MGNYLEGNYLEGVTNSVTEEKVEEKVQPKKSHICCETDCRNFKLPENDQFEGIVMARLTTKEREHASNMCLVHHYRFLSNANNCSMPDCNDYRTNNAIFCPQHTCDECKLQEINRGFLPVNERCKMCWLDDHY